MVGICNSYFINMKNNYYEPDLVLFRDTVAISDSPLNYNPMAGIKGCFTIFI